MNEIWKDIEGFEGLYKISNYGKVKAIRSNRICFGSYDKDGYRQLALSKNGVKKWFKVHRLVAGAFIANTDKFSDVNHKDEVKTNNHIENLEWCARAYNNQYGSRGKPVIQVKNDNIVEKYRSITKAAKTTGNDISNIIACCQGRQKTCGGYVWRYAN